MRHLNYRRNQMAALILPITTTAIPIPMPAQAPVDRTGDLVPFIAVSLLKFMSLFLPLQLMTKIIRSLSFGTNNKQSKSPHGSTLIMPETKLSAGKHMIQAAYTRVSCQLTKQ